MTPNTIATNMPAFARLTLRAAPSDTGNLAAIASAMGTFVNVSDAMRTAFIVAAHLAREGALQGVLKAAAAKV